MMRIAVDAMGGDHAPRSVVEGAVQAVRDDGGHVVLVGDEGKIRAELERLSAPARGIDVVHASQAVEMNESVIPALRRKKDSSMRVAARLVKEGQAAAFVSAGNTGAVMAISKILFGSLEGVDRPAIAVSVPSYRGTVVILDAGANVDCKSHHFRQFAVMGYLYARNVLSIENPRVGLLSIGEEATKGTDATREVFKVLRETRINFIGNVEGNDVYSGRVDVVVTDGFTGNVALKVSESMVENLQKTLREVIKGSPLARVGAMLMAPALRGVRRRMDYAEYGGAPLLGARECVIISHGRSSPKAIRNAIRVARDFVDREVNRRIEAEIRTLTEAETRLVS